MAASGHWLGDYNANRASVGAPWERATAYQLDLGTVSVLGGAGWRPEVPMKAHPVEAHGGKIQEATRRCHRGTVARAFALLWQTLPSFQIHGLAPLPTTLEAIRDAA